MYGKKSKNTFSSEINSNLCQCLYYVSGILNIPTIKKTTCFARLWPKRENGYCKNALFWPILVLKVTCVFGPINRGLFGPNERFPGTFWPNPSLLGCLRSLKKNWVKTRVTKFFMTFSIFGRFCRFGGVLHSHGAGWPPKQAKKPNGGQKNVFWS